MVPSVTANVDPKLDPQDAKPRPTQAAGPKETTNKAEAEHLAIQISFAKQPLETDDGALAAPAPTPSINPFSSSKMSVSLISPSSSVQKNVLLNNGENKDQEHHDNPTRTSNPHMSESAALLDPVRHLTGLMSQLHDSSAYDSALRQTSKASVKSGHPAAIPHDSPQTTHHGSSSPSLTILIPSVSVAENPVNTSNQKTATAKERPTAMPDKNATPSTTRDLEKLAATSNPSSSLGLLFNSGTNVNPASDSSEHRTPIDVLDETIKAQQASTQPTDTPIPSEISARSKNDGSATATQSKPETGLEPLGSGNSSPSPQQDNSNALDKTNAVDTIKPSLLPSSHQDNDNPLGKMTAADTAETSPLPSSRQAKSNTRGDPNTTDGAQITSSPASKHSNNTPLGETVPTDDAETHSLANALGAITATDAAENSPLSSSQQANDSVFGTANDTNTVETSPAFLPSPFSPSSLLLETTSVILSETSKSSGLEAPTSVGNASKSGGLATRIAAGLLVLFITLYSSL